MISSLSMRGSVAFTVLFFKTQVSETILWHKDPENDCFFMIHKYANKFFFKSNIIIFSSHLKNIMYGKTVCWNVKYLNTLVFLECIKI